jgi:hypothetical protein
MNSKKAITLLVLATLVMSLVPVLPVSAVAITNSYVAGPTPPTVVDLIGDYGDTVSVLGTGVTSGNTIELYWDVVSAAGLLNSTTGEPDGTYEVWFDVPSDVGGAHYLWVKDVATGEVDMLATPYVVVPRIKLSEDEGLPDDEITVTGYGFGDEEVMNITFGAAGLGVLISTSPSEVETSDAGYFSATFDIPAATADGPYVVNATEFGDAVWDSNGFTVGAAITLDVDEGPAGTVITITGRGFNASRTDLDEGNVTIAGSPMAIEDDDTFDTSSTGTFSQKVIMPSLAVGDKTISVTDGVKTATADFEVLGVSEIEVDPEYAAPGATISVSGYNFTQIAGSTLSFTIGGSSVSDSITVDADGTFVGDLTMPALALGAEKPIVAVDENGLNATVNILSGVLTVLLSDYEAPVGAEISLTASGLKGTLNYNVTVDDDEQLLYGAVGGVTAISDTFVIPSLTAGVHTLTFEDEGWDISVDIDITVSDVAALTISPSAGAPDNYNVTIYGVNFVEEDGLGLTWTLSNSTDSWDISADILTTGAVATTDGDGVIDAYWNVSAGSVDVLEIGAYLLNVTMDASANHADAPAVWAEIAFNVLAEEWDISIKKDSYAVGDTITYNIRATFPKEDAELTITDPDSYTYWVATLGADDWVEVGDWETVPVGYQVGDNSAAPFTLSEDAPLGTWTWAIEDASGDELEAGSFEVVEAADNSAAVEAAVEAAIEASVLDLVADIEALADEIVDYSSSFDSVADDIAAVADVAADAVAAANAAADAVTSVASVAGDAADAAADAAEAANAAKDAASGLTTLVYGAIGAALVAALAAIVSLMQISRRIAG